MKRNISDLMDDYPAELTEFINLDNDNPLSSLRVKELTMNKIIPNKTKKSRNFIRAAIVAACLAVFSVSAFAVSYVLGAGTSFQDFFARNGSDITTKQVEIMDKMGKTFETGVTSNGATIIPVAALADEKVYYLKLQLKAPENVVLPDYSDTEGYYQLFGANADESIELNLSSYKDPGYEIQCEWLNDDAPSDNVKEVIVIFKSMPGSDLKFNDNISKNLTIHGLWLQSPDKEYTQIFDGEFNFDIGLYYEDQVISLDCNGLVWQDELGYTITLTKLELSPLSLSYKYYVAESYNENEIEPGVGPCEILFTDGSSKALKVAYSNGDEGYFIFEEPLDLAQIDCVKYGEHKISVH